MTGAALPASRYRPANDLASRTHSRHPRRLGDRRGSRGPAGGRPRACPSRLEDVASARDVCQFPAMPCQSCDATSRATPRAPPKHPFRRRIPPSDGLAGGRDVVISPDLPIPEGVVPDQPSPQKNCQPGAEVHGLGGAILQHDGTCCAQMCAGSDIREPEWNIRGHPALGDSIINPPRHRTDRQPNSALAGIRDRRVVDGSGWAQSSQPLKRLPALRYGTAR